MQDSQLKTMLRDGFPSHNRRGHGLSGLERIFDAFIREHRQLYRERGGLSDPYVFQSKNFRDEHMENELVARAKSYTTGKSFSEEALPKVIVDGVLLRFRFGEKGEDDNTIGHCCVSIDYKYEGVAEVESQGLPHCTSGLIDRRSATVLFLNQIVAIMRCNATRLLHHADSLEHAIDLRNTTHCETN